MSLRILFGFAVVFSVCSGTSLVVEGSFKCESADPDPTSLPVRVELREEDGGFLVGSEHSTVAIGFNDRDDKMDEVTVTYEDKFKLRGSEFEFGHLEPYLIIHHRCGLKPEDLWKMITLKMKPVKVSLFGQTHFEIDMGVIDLNE